MRRLSAADSPPDHEDYRKEAKHIRALAAEVQHAHAREQLLVIAALYERLAEHVGRARNTVSDSSL